MPDRPNVLLLLSDEHSYRYRGAREGPEYEPVATPTVDSLAASGTDFTDAYCSMPLCTPSRLCLLTGNRVPRAGAWSNGSMLRDDQRTLPEAFSDAGYETCLVGKMHLGGDRQFAGFDHRPYGDITGRGGHQGDPPWTGPTTDTRERTRDAGQTAIPASLRQEECVHREAVEWVREHAAGGGVPTATAGGDGASGGTAGGSDTVESGGSDEDAAPWFLCASFSRPHFPLTAPRRFLDEYWPDGVTEPPVLPEDTDYADHPVQRAVAEGFRTDEIADEERARARAAYFACVAYLDELLGDLLATLDRDGFLENTVVVYTSDHGEYAGEHDLWWKHGWHEGAVRVPLVVETPAQRRGDAEGHEVTAPVSLVDLVPTLCDLADVDAPDCDGASLAEGVRAGANPERGPVVTDNLVDRWGDGTEFRAVRDGDYKYVEFRGEAFPDLLFDLAADPLETTNLAADGERSDAADAALDDLRQYVAGTLDFDACERARHEDAARRDRNDLAVEGSTSGNAYLAVDGRLVDADTPLYDPSVLADSPDVFGDYPGDGPD